MADTIAALDALIGGFLAGTTGWETLEAQYSPVYLFLPDEAFPDVETEVWYGVVHERIEWTTAEPSPEQKTFGWMTHAEFRGWLEEAVRTKPAVGEG